MNLRPVLKRALQPLLKPIVFRILSVERTYTYQNIKATIKPGVFHPGWFFSTRLLLDFLKNFSLQNKSFLEPGAGSGLISVYAAQKGARVTALDISQAAVQSIRLNAAQNHVAVNVIESDLFQNLPAQRFDYIIINPPYYKDDPKDEREFAWYCGAHLEFFYGLFRQLSSYTHENSCVYMVLSDECDITGIMQLARQYGFTLIKVFEKQLWWEKNFIYAIRTIDPHEQEHKS